MPGTSVSHKYFLCSHSMIATSISGTSVNGMTVVDATADSITFDNPDTHVGGDSGVIDSWSAEVVGRGKMHN